MATLNVDAGVMRCAQLAPLWTTVSPVAASTTRVHNSPACERGAENTPNAENAVMRQAEALGILMLELKAVVSPETPLPT